MQRTRLNVLIINVTDNCRNFLTNPWRNLSIIIICWLFGFSCPSLITSSVSQSGIWDASVAFVFLVFTELINRILYSRSNIESKPWWRDILYSFRLGFVYGLFLDASILTS